MLPRNLKDQRDYRVPPPQCAQKAKGILQVASAVFSLHAIQRKQATQAKTIAGIIGSMIDDAFMAPIIQMIHRGGIAYIVVHAKDESRAHIRGRRIPWARHWGCIRHMEDMGSYEQIQVAFQPSSHAILPTWVFGYFIRDGLCPIASVLHAYA